MGGGRRGVQAMCGAVRLGRLPQTHRKHSVPCPSLHDHYSPSALLPPPPALSLRVLSPAPGDKTKPAHGQLARSIDPSRAYCCLRRRLNLRSPSGRPNIAHFAAQPRTRDARAHANEWRVQLQRRLWEAFYARVSKASRRCRALRYS